MEKFDFLDKLVEENIIEDKAIEAKDNLSNIWKNMNQVPYLIFSYENEKEGNIKNYLNKMKHTFKNLKSSYKDDQGNIIEKRSMIIYLNDKLFTIEEKAKTKARYLLDVFGLNSIIYGTPEKVEIFVSENTEDSDEIGYGKWETLTNVSMNPKEVFDTYLKRGKKFTFSHTLINPKVTSLEHKLFLKKKGYYKN